ncbi:MAG: MBL fold metallo-hydrolase, partial [Kiritimatiellia bacterium]
MLTWLGQSGFLLESGGVRLAIDPYLSDSLAPRGFERTIPPPISSDDLRADFIVCTHDHGDHFDPDTILPALQVRPDTCVIGPASVVRHGEVLGLPVTELSAKSPPLECGPFTLRAVPAHHSDPAAIGLRIDCENYSIHHTGDTTTTDDLAARALNFGPVDLLLVCINGRLGNMSATEAA